MKDINPASYAFNFPTTGADGLYFDLIIYGDIDEDELTWSPVMHEGITATVKKIAARDSWAWVLGNMTPDEEEFFNSHIFMRVTLTGPEARTQWYNSYPSLIAKPRLPQTFELVGKDRKGNEVVKYGFVLQKWFVTRGDGRKSQPEQISWCSRLGYRLSQARDLTNSVCSPRDVIHNNCQGIVTSTPSSDLNGYKFNIGAFLTEWGYTPLYTGAGFYSDVWVSDELDNRRFIMLIDTGGIHGARKSETFYEDDRNAICTIP
ncbi:hypothetical protein [Gilliamella sp. ESL0250]|uniref:hypothetical protein n=1 Tax=Gilliamella sp. ESL0250 TaxID=2705036 RepID=UPI0015805B73|nr:hypothetical protein [Gilliamella sp. ESL0250]NUF49774.1 hypothetical protein [Gilliamella sp. ESL0250]